MKPSMGIVVAFLVFLLGFATTNGAKCGDISGIWQNELGSRMLLKVHDGSNRITGEYYTAVETIQGAAAFVSNITGLFSKQSEGSLLSFTVLFNHGSSLASWVGQCVLCEDKEALQTTYTLRRHVPSFQEKWASVITNQNTFWRLENESGNTLGSATARLSSPRILSVVSQRQPGGLELNGKWKSSNSEELEIFGMNGDVLEGKHQTADLIGRKDGNDVFTAVALMSTSNKRIRSWTGYVYSSESSPHTLETSWLEHEFATSCESSRSVVRYGVQNFTHIVSRSENMVYKSESFMDKLRKFFSSIF